MLLRKHPRFVHFALLAALTLIRPKNTAIERDWAVHGLNDIAHADLDSRAGQRETTVRPALRNSQTRARKTLEDLGEEALRNVLSLADVSQRSDVALRAPCQVRHGAQRVLPTTRKLKSQESVVPFPRPE